MKYKPKSEYRFLASVVALNDEIKREEAKLADIGHNLDKFVVCYSDTFTVVSVDSESIIAINKLKFFDTLEEASRSAALGRQRHMGILLMPLRYRTAIKYKIDYLYSRKSALLESHGRVVQAGKRATLNPFKKRPWWMT